MTVFGHIPVLLHDAVNLLITSPEGVYVDATSGLGGHTEEMAKRVSYHARLVAFEVDPDALTISSQRLNKFSNVEFIQRNFRYLKVELTRLNALPVRGILFDLGLSSLEIDNPAKGFSFTREGPLDMRMDPTLPESAAHLINTATEERLKEIIRTYGEERFAGRIARTIAETRDKVPLQSTRDLESLVRQAVHGPHQVKSLARVFQAFRIAVNRELEALEKALPDAFECLEPGGRLVVISYHSLEDRLVKSCFKDLCTDCVCPPDQPVCTCTHVQKARYIQKKALIPTEDEIRSNPRSRSARLRCIEKL
ncbi:MAG: Ribosomal RNA small subunit methyltransferase H [Marinimicrobia bacterium 46_47]|nr:MAG: Ribosomal RNA small subunit methyltransferase H [Marinimicrobia bacterium 46_47]KUK89262.1 MAG: S-adenosyl-methyltransferase MraW [Marinimicrobia bacterium 46_43]